MKNIKYLIIAFACALFTGCMDDEWEAVVPAENPFGNQALTETNVISIADLRKTYANIINNSDTFKIKDDVQIKGWVTSNDIGGNIYNQISIDDGTGSMIICIAQGGLFGQLPEGQEILVSLKDLYIGGYSKQPEIGVPYTNKNGKTYVSRMSRYLWQEHYKAIGAADLSKVQPEIFDKSKVKDATYMEENCGKLMTIEDVEFEDADGYTVFATEDEKDDGNSVNRSFKGISASNMVVRTSTYADFANEPLPGGKVKITGVFTRYNNLWQILIRKESDFKDN